MTARLLAEQEVQDLTVEDPPIEDVIEIVFSQDAEENGSERAAGGGGAIRSFLDYYVVCARTQIQSHFQYRVATYMCSIGMLAEPIVYLVVWTTIAEQQGGSVQGISVGEFAAYYIIWTLVRNMNIVFTPYGWEWRIREGEFSASLLRPLHPLHEDLAGFAGWKVVTIVLWLPIAAVLVLDLRPGARPLAARGRRVRGRDLGRLPDPDDAHVAARDDHVLDDARERDLRARSSPSSCSSRAGLVPIELMPDWAEDSRTSSRSCGRSTSRSRRSSATSRRRSSSAGSRRRLPGRSC